MALAVAVAGAARGAVVSAAVADAGPAVAVVAAVVVMVGAVVTDRSTPARMPRPRGLPAVSGAPDALFPLAQQ